MPIDSRITGFALPFVWGLIVFASWIGWGKFLASIALGKTSDSPDIYPLDIYPPDIGLRAGWGMCITIFLGGILNALNLCSPTTIGALIAIGAIIFLSDLFHHAPSHSQSAILPLLPLLILATLIYAGSICWRYSWNEFDDFVAYMVYPIKMLQSGAAHDPFSWRRLSTVGGYSFLEAGVSIFSGPQNTFLTDVGLGGILNCLLTVPVLRRAGASPLLASLAGIICLTLPLGRVNSMSYCLGLAGFLLLFRTADYLSKCPPAKRSRHCFITGAVAAAITTIRPNFLPVAVMALLLTEFLWIMRRQTTVRIAIRELTFMTLGGILLFAPWSIALHAAAGSWFYPILKGNQQTAVDVFSRHLGAVGTIKFTLSFFLRPKMLALMAVGVIALWVSNSAATALWIGAVIGAAMVVTHFTTSDFVNLTRYTLPSLAAATVAAWISTQFHPAQSLIARVGKAILITFAILLVTIGAFLPSGVIWRSIKSIDLALIRNEPFYGLRDAAIYPEAQSHVPPGATILTFAPRPFLLDYRRNTIYSADYPGMASLPPGYPFFQGSAALAQYLRSHSIDYLICADFDNDTAIYARKLYRRGDPSDIIVVRMASRALDLFQNIDDLAAASPLVFNQGGLWVIRLR